MRRTQGCMVTQDVAESAFYYRSKGGSPRNKRSNKTTLTIESRNAGSKVCVQGTAHLASDVVVTIPVM